MKRSLINSLTLLGCALILMGVTLLALDRLPARAQDEPPEYVGADECSSCHRNLARDHADTNHALALQDTGRDKDPILGDFEQGEDVRQVQLLGEDEPRAFNEDDIAYAIGAGVHVQRYLYEVDRDEYMVLPAEWNVAAQAWEPYTLADEWPSEAYDWEQNCVACHTTGFDVERERWEDDGVQCEACHGPASNHVELADDAGRRPSDEELAELRGAIYRSPDAQVCGACHSRGVGEDDRPYPVGYVPGATLSDYFTLVPEDSADHWWLSGHAKQPNMQYNEWLLSAHATSLADMQASDYADDSCLTCHSEDARLTDRLIALVEEGERDGEPLDPLTVSSAQWGVTCTTCHNQHSDAEQPFNLVDEANALCTGCHTNPEESTGIHHPVVEMFQGVTLVEGIEGVPGDHFSNENGPRCVTCHMQPVPVETSVRSGHSFQPILPGASEELPSACAECHDDLTTTDLALLVGDTQDAVAARLSAARSQLEALPEPDEGSDAAARYQQVTAALNFVENDGSLGIHNYKYADALLSAAESDLAALSAGDGAAPTEETTEAAPTPLPTPVPTVSAGETTDSGMTGEVVESGVRPVTLVVIAAVIGILLISAFVFFRRPAA